MYGHKVVLCNVEGNTLRAVMYTVLQSAGWDATYPPFFDKPCLDPILLMAIAHLPDLPITVSDLLFSLTVHSPIFAQMTCPAYPQLTFLRMNHTPSLWT